MMSIRGRTLLLFALIGISIVVASCGVVDKAWVEFFCAWGYDKTCKCERQKVRNKEHAECKVDEKIRDGVPKDNQLLSDCICGLDQGKVQGWFRNRPRLYNTFPKDLIELTSTRCENLDVCPTLSNGLQHVITGTTYVEVEDWTHTTWINGYEVWTVIGRKSEKQLADAGFPHLAIRPLNPLVGRMMSVKFSNNPLDCKRVCDPRNPDDVLCRDSTPNKTTRHQLGELHNIVAGTSDGTIAMSDLKNIFNVTDDDCSRGDLQISPTSIKSQGEACRIDATIWIGQKPFRLFVHVPEKLEGKLSKKGSAFALDFASKERAFTLEMSDAGLNSELGGSIEFIESTPLKALITTERACIGVDLDK